MEKDGMNEMLVPGQYQGSDMGTVEKRSGRSNEEADRIFERACRRLLDVNSWGRLAGVSAFQLMDTSGISVDREAREGDYIRIDIPGPATMAGMGYDWVRVEEIKSFEKDGIAGLGMRVRPSAHPVSGNPETAHFLQETATSTFIIRREGNAVSAEEHGRNEVANTSAGNLIDKGRNMVVGLAAKLGLSYPQWKSLVKAFLAD
ncbi:hypothetical protein OC25_02070 [Pedobacter kyungheensis]|uniref:Uncharacterized protein n=2 Tax=Pedobacter kyungheensis TaxID=1069985 RepID=A0A0C1G8X2_9SPHI|nr:hypothetical protein OC25_02070 [Pedobacter kyungheensis]